MSSKFKINVNNEFEFDFVDKDISAFNAVKTVDSKYHILQNNKPYTAEIIHTDFNKKTYQVKVNNNTYDVTIANELDIAIKEMGFSLSSTKHVNFIKAPMPGLIIDVQCKVDQVVKENDPLLVLEAMKMENVIVSPREGVIKSISASIGDAVDKGQLLIEFQ